MVYEHVVRGGTVVTADDVMPADVGLAGGKIVAIGQNLPAGASETDAAGKLVLPGGVDSHCHIEQLAATGLVNADTFLSATTAAAMGGTTTVIPFAAQHIGMSAAQVTADYHELAARQAVVDYAFHMIITDPTPSVLKQELPTLIKDGHGSIKLFMTYDRLRIGDENMLEVMAVAREHQAMITVHAENHGMISWVAKRLVDRGYTAAKYHNVSHPRVGEVEAFHRVIAMSALLDQPIMIFHVSTAEGAKVIHDARGDGLKIFGETCTQYLTLTKAEMDKPGIDGLKWVCSPPLREPSDQAALWRALAAGTLQTITSDHAPYRMDDTGKLNSGPNPSFKAAANGMPGVEMRMPILFDACVSQGRMPVTDFVRLTSTAPAKIYGLADRKGSIAIGKDADLVLWDAEKSVTLSDATTHDLAGYNPYAGRTIKGWPETVIRRGEVIVADGALQASPGSGQFLARQGGLCAQGTGQTAPELDPAQNYGAELL